MTEKSLIDCHVHLAALPGGNNGCYISPKTLKSPLFRFLLWKHQLSPDKPREANQKYLDDLLTELRASRHVQKAVLLGMDGVYDQNGRLNQAHTDFLIGNDYVLETARAYPNEFLAGVSINPQRRDAVEEVHRCADAGATLVKVLPNAQQFNPADTRCKAFYRALAERNLPFLSHVGYEFSLIGKDQSVGDPDRLRVALDEGTTVIAAHACSYGLMFYEKFFPTFQDLAKPDGALPKNTRVDVLKDGKVVQSGYGNQSWDLLSGAYEVTISGKRVPNVTVKAGHDTTVKVGVLRVSAGKDTKVDVLDAGNKLTSDYGDQVIGFPPGSFDIQVAGQTERVTISEGNVTDF